MQWENFEESSYEYPDVLIASQAKNFDKATKYLADIQILELSKFDRLSSGVKTDFQYETILISPYMKNYKYSLFKFGYDVNIYPVLLRINYEIATEIYSSGMEVEEDTVFQFDTEEELIQVFNTITKTKVFLNTVSGLMKIALKYKSINKKKDEKEEETET